MHACMHAGVFVDRRCRIDRLRIPLYASFQLCRVCFLLGLAFSQWLSVFSKVDVFLDKGLKSSRKFACFSGSVETLLIVLPMASAFSEHSLWSIHKGCSSCVDWTKALLSLTIFKMNETEKKIELERRESLSEWVPDEWHLADVGECVCVRERERERDRLDKQRERCACPDPS